MNQQIVYLKIQSLNRILTQNTFKLDINQRRNIKSIHIMSNINNMNNNKKTATINSNNDKQSQIISVCLQKKKKKNKKIYLCYPCTHSPNNKNKK